MALELTIGADVQPAITALRQMKDGLKSLKDQLDKTTDPAEVNRLTKAIVDQKNQIQQAQAATNGFANSTFGVSRAARVAHNDLDQTVRSLEGFSRGSQGAVDGLGNLIFTFERLKGVTGSTGSALGALGEALLSPAGLVLALGAAIPLIIEAVDKFDEMSSGSRQAKAELDALTESLKKNKVVLEGFNEDLDNANITRKLKIDLVTGPGTQRTLAELNSDLDAAKTKLAGTTPALKEWQGELDKLIAKNKQIDDQQKATGASLSKEGKAFVENNQKKIDELQKQITEFKKIESKAQEDITNIPIRIQVVEADKAREDAKKAAEEAARAAKEAAKRAVSDIKVTEGLIVLTNLKIRSQNVSFDVTAKGAPEALTNALGKGVQTPEEAAKSFKKLNEELEKATSFSQALKLRVDIGDLEKARGAVAGSLGGITTEAANAANAINDALTPAFAGMFDAIKSHGNVLQGFFKGLEQAVASLITKLITAAAIAEIVSVLVPGAGGFKSIFSSLLGFAIPKHAKGGIATSPTLGIFGEAGTEVLMPLDKLKGLLGGIALQSGNDREWVLRGNDLALALKRTDRTNNRSF